MQKNKIGKSDLHVTKICLGTWAIGGESQGEYSEKDAVKAVETSIDSGINFIDTAPAYGRGHAEKLLGEIIKPDRESLVIATKCGLDIEKRFKIDLTPEFLDRDLAGSLKRLGTDYIDLYQCHWPDPKTPIAETMEALNKFKEEGKIKYIGVSNFSYEQLEEACKYAEITSVQPHYSLLERSVENDLVPFCVENQIGILSYGSLGAGMLTGKYTEWPQFKRDDTRSFFYKFFKKEYWPKVNDLLKYMRKMADEKDTKVGHIAIAWLLAQEAVDSTIVGARTAEQAKDNLGGAELELTPEEIKELSELSARVYK